MISLRMLKTSFGASLTRSEALSWATGVQLHDKVSASPFEMRSKLFGDVKDTTNL